MSSKGKKASSPGASADAGYVNPTGGAYIDDIVNDESDIRDIKAARDRVIPEKDKRILGILAGLDAFVFVLIGVFLVFTGSADEYDSIKGESAFNMKTAYYDPSGVLEALSPSLAETDFPADMRDGYKALYSVNDDTIGWVSIDGTPVDYVVVQSDTNSYYERKDFNRDYSVKGIIFMDYRNKPGSADAPLSKNTVLYGHHMASDGTVFTCLENYTDLEYYKEHPVIEYNTIYGDYKWKIIGAFLNYPNDPSEGDDLFYYWYTDFCDENTLAFANEVANRSFVVNTSVDVRPTDKFLTLSTCTYMLDRGSRVNARFVVIARLVRDGEKAEVDVDKAYANENRRMPQLWYDINDLDNPYADVPIWVAY